MTPTVFDEMAGGKPATAPAARNVFEEMASEEPPVFGEAPSFSPSRQPTAAEQRQVMGVGGGRVFKTLQEREQARKEFAEPLAAVGEIPFDLAGQAVSGLAGLRELIHEDGKGLDAAARKVEQVGKAAQDLLHYTPETPAGETAQKTIAYPFEKLAEGGRYLGEQTMEATGSPAAGAAVDTAVNMLPFVLPFAKRGAVAGLEALKNSDVYRRMTIPERSLVVQTFEDSLRNGVSEADLARMNPEFRAEAIKRRMQTESGTVFDEMAAEKADAGIPIPPDEAATGIPVAIHDDLQNAAVTGRDSLNLQNTAPEVKPVVKMTPAEALQEKRDGNLQGKVIFQPPQDPGVVYVLDPFAVHGVIGSDSVVSSTVEAKRRLAKGDESELLGYPERGPQDVAVTKQGEVITDLNRMKQEAEAGNVAWAADGKPEEAIAKAQQVAEAIQKGGDVLGKGNEEAAGQKADGQGRDEGLLNQEAALPREGTVTEPSKVAAPAPIVAYHGTGKDFTDYQFKGNIGPHFGTQEQANGFASEYPEGGHVRKVALDIKNPLRLDDGGWENPAMLILKLQDKGILDASIGNDFYDGKISEEEMFARIRKAVAEKGYDGIVYDNRGPEGRGDSYIPLDPQKQVQNFYAGRNEAPSGAAFADSGAYADTGPGTAAGGGQRTNPFDPSRRVNPLEMPELVELAREINEGKYPRVLKNLRVRDARGLFRHGGNSGSIEIRADLFKDTADVMKTIAHEIGHLVDWLPDKTMGRGNILGRIASLKRYMKSLLQEFEGAPGQVLTEKDRARLKREAKEQVKAEERPDQTIIEEVIREVPVYETVGITPEMVQAIWKDVTSRDKYPELYKAVARMTAEQKKAVMKQALKGMVDESLSHLGEKVFKGTERQTVRQERVVPGKKATPADIAARYRKLLKEEIEKRRLYEKEVIDAELKALTQWWKPFDERVNPGYTKYRHKSAELYADALSVLFNDPGALESRAPTFYKAFFSWMDSKPAVKSTFDDIQNRMMNPDEVQARRQENVRGMFERGEEAKKATEERPLVNILDSIKKDLIDVNYDLIRKVKDARKNGAVIDDATNPVYWVEQLPYVSSEVYNHLSEIDANVLAPMKGAGLSADDLGEYMLYRRVTSDRADIANPLGHTKETAEAGLDALRRKLGDDRFQQLQQFEQEYRAIRERNVLKVVDDAKMWGGDFMKYVRDNEAYATFDVQKFIEQRYGRGVSAQVYRQVGTLQEVRNPFIATVMKDAALIRATNVKQAKKATTDFLKQHFPADISPADTQWNGRANVAVEPKDPKRGMIAFPHEGKIKGYYVPKGIAETFNRDPYEAGAIIKVWQAINVPLRNILVSKNPLWMIANVPRDFVQTWKQVPDLGFFELMKYYGKAAPEAWVNVFRNEQSRDVRAMLKGKMVVQDRQFSPLDESPDSELDRMLQQFGHTKEQYHNRVVRPFLWLWDHLGKMGQFTERLGKLAGYKYLQDQGRTSPMKTAHMVRSRIGTPDVKRGGRLKIAYNNIFLFSNVAKEGWRSSWEGVKEAPSDYAWKTTRFNVMPKLVMVAAAAGLIGKELKEIMDKASDYDKTNYHIIPLGLTKEGKAVYWRIPQDYTGTLVGGLIWNLSQGRFAGEKSALTFTTEQSPYGLNPFLAAASDVVQYMQGRNPYDSYRGQLAIPDDVFKAKDSRALKALGKYEWNQLGGSVVYRFSGDGPDRVESELEKVLKVPPGNILGRFLKVTDYGEREQLREVGGEVQKETARKSLDVRERIIDDINAHNGRASIPDMVKLYRDMLQEGKVDPETKWPEFRARYQRYLTKAAKSAKVDAVASAGSNEEKAAILQKLKDTMPPMEFDNLQRQLILEGHVKKGALKEMVMRQSR